MRAGACVSRDRVAVALVPPGESVRVETVSRGIFPDWLQEIADSEGRLCIATPARYFRELKQASKDLVGIAVAAGVESVSLLWDPVFRHTKPASIAAMRIRRATGCEPSEAEIAALGAALLLGSGK